MKFVNAMPGTSTMMAPMTTISMLMGRPRAHRLYATMPSTRAAPKVLMKKLTLRRSSTMTHRPVHTAAMPAASPSSRPPRKKRVKKRAPQKYPSRIIHLEKVRQLSPVFSARAFSPEGSGGSAHTARLRALYRSTASMSVPPTAWVRYRRVRVCPSASVMDTIRVVGMANTLAFTP